MKIIIVGPAFPLRGGIANFNEALCRALNKAGHDTQIFSFSLQYPSLLFPGKTQFDNGNPPSDLKIITKINSINPFNWRNVANEICNENPDLLIVRYWLPFMAPCLGTIVKKVKKNSKAKIIAITDNVIPHEKRMGDNTLTKYFVKQCDAFIAMSKSVLDDLKFFTDNPNTAFLPHPIYDIFGEKISKQEAMAHLKLNPNEKHILFFGFIRKYKGLDLLLEAMRDERIKKLGVKLIVAGEFYENDLRYKEIIRKHDLQNIILKTHYILSEEVKYYFCASDMVVQPYRVATQSGVTQVAYHFERPMLVTNVGGLAEIVPKTVGYAVEPSVQKIADAITDFYQNKRETEFSLNTVEGKKRFSWDSFIDGVMKLYNKI